MPTVAKAASPIRVSEDRLRVEFVPSRVDPHLMNVDDLLSELAEDRIQINDQLTATLRQLQDRAHSGDWPTDPIVLIEGRPPVPGVGAQIEFAAAQHAPTEAERTDFYESHITTVAEGEVVGILTPACPPQDGQDVFGQPIPAAPASSTTEVGENIRLDADGRTLIATTAGKVHLSAGRILVLDVVETPGDVDFSTGNISSQTDVLIGGTVRNTFTVKSTKNVAVRGAIEAAFVEACGDVQVSGGIAGCDRGQVVAGGSITTKFCSEAHLRAGGDITISRECFNSRVHAGSRLIMPRGKLVGGAAYAREGAEIKFLGNATEKPTEIAIGLDPATLAKTSQIEELMKKKTEACARIREKVQPLMAQLGRLTPQQREKATELLHQADQMEAEIHMHEVDMQTLVHATTPRDRGALLVTGTLYPGVKVIFGDRMTIFRKEHKGPIKIERRLIDRVEEICVIESGSGSVTTLISYEYQPTPETPDKTDKTGKASKTDKKH